MQLKLFMLHLIKKLFRQINFADLVKLMDAKLIARFSKVGNNSFFDNRQFAWVEDLELNWEKIRQELDQVLEYKDKLPNFQDISVEQYSITKDNLWKTYFLYGYGVKVENNCKMCPETTRLIEKIPGMKTAFFSILYPHKHIPKHRGYYKGVLRYHLGLVVPQQKKDCWISVNNDVRYWEEGKSLIFDDTYLHEVENNTDEIRVVLFLDFVRPMYFPFSILNTLILKLLTFSPFIQNAKKNQEKWENRIKKEKREIAEII